MIVNVAKNNIGPQISRLQSSHAYTQRWKAWQPKVYIDKSVSTYIHIITHVKQIFYHFEYDKVCKNDNHWPLCHATAAELPPSVTLLYLTPSFPQATSFHTSPLLSSAFPVTFTCYSHKAVSMKVMDLNQQPIVSLCKWACAGVHCGNSYVWACVQVL